MTHTTEAPQTVITCHSTPTSATGWCPFSEWAEKNKADPVLIRCESCRGIVTGSVAAHETYLHGGAHTCWPVTDSDDHGSGCDGPLNCVCGPAPKTMVSAPPLDDFETDEINRRARRRAGREARMTFDQLAEAALWGDL